MLLAKNIISSLVFPHYCPVCGEVWTECEGYICPQCWRQLQRRTGKRVAEDLIVRDRIFITFAYNDITRMLVHQMKFRGRSDIAARLGRTVADCLYRILLNLNIATVIPVPLHPVRVRERGYNQNIIIAENFAERLKLPVRADLIRRVRNTPPQSRLSDAERKVNLIGAFAPVLSNRPNPMGMVVLIDDVFHTGSTLRGCLEALEKCGIKEVIAVTAFG